MALNTLLFEQITRTKVIPPRRRADLLSRQRLLELFYDLLDYKLIIIAAPAGYGKTSLLVDVAHHSDFPVCWYAVDPLDSDPQRFIAHFIAAIAQRFAEVGRQAAAVLEGLTLDETGLDRLVTVMVNELYEHIHEHFIIVLDDYHLVENKIINHFVNRFIQHVDENCHLVVSSRKLLSLPDLVLMVGRSQVGGVGLNDLAFQVEEIQALVSQNYNQDIPQEVAEELIQETEGWITGLLLSTQTIWQGMVDRLRVARISGVGLYDYLAQQVLEQQSPTVQDFLLRTSLLEEFDAELCENVLGPTDYPGGETWAELVDTVSRNNLFVLPVGERGTWLRYHHLFQDFLQSRMEAEHPDGIVSILRQLAAVYAQRKAWEKAHNLYRRLDDTEATADLVEQAGLPMVESGRFLTLGNWIDTLPNEIVTSRPLLLSLHGYVAVILGEVKHGLDLLNQAETAFRQLDDTPNLTRTLVWRAGVNRLLGQYQASLSDADEALTLVEGDENNLKLKAEALRAKGQSLSSIGQLPEAIEYLGYSLTAFKSLHDIQNVSRLLAGLGLAQMRAGRYERALAHYKPALDYWQKVGNTVRQAELLNNLGVLHHLKGDYERAALNLEGALTCAQQSAYARLEGYIVCSIGDLYTELDALEAAQIAYHRARKIAQHLDDRFLLLYLNLAEVALIRLQGNLDQTRKSLNSAKQLVQKSTSNYEQGLYQLASGRLVLAETQGPEAVIQLEKAAHYFEQGGQQIEAACAYLHLALAQHTLKDRQAAKESLKYVFQRTAKLESHHRLVVAGRDALPLLEATQRDKKLGSQVTELLEQVVQFEQNIPMLRRRLRRKISAVPFAPPKLTIQALGKGQVMLDGELVTSSEWQTQRRVREFFFYLLTHPDGQTREAIGAVFWPESSPSQLKLQFKNTIYRLRRALDDKDVVLYDSDEDSYCFNWQSDYEYDVEMFQQELKRAQTTTNLEEMAAAYQAAIELYQGPYLPEIDGTWAWPKREQLARDYLEANLKLAEYYLEREEYHLALKYCHKALAEDPCLEEAHRQAMRAYAALGNRVEIIRQFEQCQQALLDEINAPVSPQTQKLYEMLIR